MTRYLIRGGENSKHSVAEIINRNSIGDNSGNILYLFSVCKTLFNDNVEIEFDNYAAEGGRYNNKDIEIINEKYNAYIVPLADAFRDNFKEKLSCFAKFFKKLKIPCYVIGVGLRAPYDTILNETFPFDEQVKEFVSAVLDKSTCLGLRGEITGKYLNKLGFMPDRDFVPIGCPSMYTFGNNLFQRPLTLSTQSKISVNYTNDNSTELVKFLFDLTSTYPNSQFVGQNINELRLLYTGIEVPPPYDEKNIFMPYKRDSVLIQKDKVKFFVRATDWFENMSSVDLSIGGRFHGNVAAILGGAPAIIVPKDARMKELIEFHHIPFVLEKDILEKSNLMEILEKIDLTSHLKVQEKNFDNFLSFLKRNNIENIYSNDAKRKDTPFDSTIPETEKISSFIYCTPQELSERFSNIYSFLKKQNVSLKKREKTLLKWEEKANDYQNEANKYKSELDQTNSDLYKTKINLTNCKTELDQYKKDIEKLEKDFINNKSELEKRIAELDQCKNDIEKLKKDILNTKSDLDKRTAELNKCKNELNDSKKECIKFKNKFEAAQKVVDEWHNMTIPKFIKKAAKHFAKKISNRILSCRFCGSMV